MLGQSGVAAILGSVLLAVIGVTPAQAAEGPRPGRYEARLQELGITLPPPPKPVASYVPLVRTGNLIFLSGQGPVVAGKATVTGKLGAEISEQQGYQIARGAALNALSALRAELGSLDRVRRIVKLTGWVSSAPGFTRQPWVINGASDLMVQVFGDAGKHARSAVSANILPLDMPLEIDFIVEVEPDSSSD